MKTNAKVELLKIIAEIPFSTLKCANIYKQEDEFNDNFEHIIKEYSSLSVNHTPLELEQFLNSLGTINYDNGYGGQKLFGTVWFEDDSWLERGEHDGSEWWEHKKTPTIPKELYKILKRII